jgi:hypothetical protein
MISLVARFAGYEDGSKRYHRAPPAAALPPREALDKFIPAVNPQFPMNAHPMAVRRVDADA